MKTPTRQPATIMTTPTTGNFTRCLKYSFCYCSCCLVRSSLGYSLQLHHSTTFVSDCDNRIVVYGDDMYDAVVKGSAQPFNFQRAYRLSDEQVRLTLSMEELRSIQKTFIHSSSESFSDLFFVQTQEISDHYPVEVELREPRGQPTKKKGISLTSLMYSLTCTM